MLRPEQPKFKEFKKAVRKYYREVLLLGTVLASLALPALWITENCVVDQDRGNTLTAGVTCSLPGSGRLALATGRGPVPDRFVFLMQAFIEDANPPHEIRQFGQLVFSQTEGPPWINIRHRFIDYSRR